ncbi:MAG: cytochrome c peroxidase [Lysobacterales bacterium]
MNRWIPIAIFAGAMGASMSLPAAGPQVPDPATDSDYYDNGAPPSAKVQLGRLLFFDKVLSGNLNSSCASCHHPLAATGDGLSLSVGEGGRGLGVTRDTGTGASAIRERVPRNAPHLFNLGAREFAALFDDGRVAADPGAPSGFDTPAGNDLPPGLDNALAAQALFPITSATEMAGQEGESAQSDAAAAGRLAGEDGVWDLIAEKLRAIPEYVDLFAMAYPGEVINAEDIDMVQAANAIAAYEAKAWRSDHSPFDQYLAGDMHAISQEARHGMRLFYGRARCGGCHQGTYLTDHAFHSVALPQIGPGKGDNQDGYVDGRDDFGRERVTGDPFDRFRFRTPSLRNVVLTAPYGHSGAYDTLEAMVRHFADPAGALIGYDTEQATLPSRPDLDAVDFVVQSDPGRLAAIADSSDALPVPLTDADVQALIAFLNTLTDPDMLDLRSEVPQRVPSGLPVWD